MSYKVYASQDWVNEKHTWDELKNKPFGEEIGRVTVLDNLQHDSYTPFDGTELHLEIGQSYDVIMDGTLYEDIVCTNNGGTYSTLIIDGGNDVFVTIYHNPENDTRWYVDDSYGYSWSTLSIYTKGTVIKTIDPKYLPEHEHRWDDLKDKPFGEEIGTVTILDNLAKENHTPFAQSIKLHLEIGQTYDVLLDGTLYEDIVCTNSGGEGTYSKIEVRDDNRLFISIHSYPSDDTDWYVDDSYGYSWSTLSIYTKGTVIKTIDPKYLPETFGGYTADEFATKEYVDNAVANVSSGGSVDLNSYATKAYVTGLGYQTEAQVLALIEANMPASAEEASF